MLLTLKNKAREKSALAHIFENNHKMLWLCLVPENVKEMKKKIQRKIVFFSLDDMENMMEKINIKENIKKNIIIFSLKNNEESKRKIKGKRGGKFYRALVHRGFTSNFLFIGGYGFSPSSTLSTATTITPTTFQCRKPTLFRHPSSHG